MAWFRRHRTTDPTSTRDLVPATSTDLVPMVSMHALERNERALRMLATQSAQLHADVVRLEARVDALSANLFDRLDLPTYNDVMDVRVHSARVASEVSRLEVNMAARLDSLRGELRSMRGESIDLRVATPLDTGWDPVDA